MKNIVVGLLLGAGLIVWATGPAYAYLDPGTGTFILQIMAAGVVGGLFYIRRIGKVIKGFFIKDDSKPEASDS